MSIINFFIALSINEACPSVSTIPIPSAQQLKPVSNQDMWEYNPEELLRFTPLRRFSSTVVVQTHPLSGLISKSIHQRSRPTQIKRGLITATGSLDRWEWCKMHNAQFPTIAKLARMYLAIPASSAPSESGVFSRAILTRSNRDGACMYTSPTARGIYYAKAQCMDASKEIS